MSKSKVSRYRLSPNEVDQLVKEEKQKRRIARIVQVREQAKADAAKVRQAVKDARAKELQKLAEEIMDEYEKEKAEKIHELETLYENCLKTIGEGHREAEQFDDKAEEVYIKLREDTKMADMRHKKALAKVKRDKALKDQEENKHIVARQLALEQERVRAAMIASLPPPPPDPLVLQLDTTKVKPVQLTDVDAFSTTHYHLQEDYIVDRADREEWGDAKAAATEEAERIAERQLKDLRSNQEQTEKARLRHQHAVQQEILKEDYKNLLVHLAELERADILKRQHLVANIPKKIFLPPSKRLEEKTDRQGGLERAFEDMYLAETDYTGDVTLALDPHPPPDSPSTTASLDLSEVEEGPKTYPRLQPTQTGPEAYPRSGVTPPQSYPRPQAAASRVPALQDVTNVPLAEKMSRDQKNESMLKKLMEKIKSQRDSWKTRADLPEPDSETLRKPLKTSESSSSGVTSTATLSQHTITSNSSEDGATGPQPHTDVGGLDVPKQTDMDVPEFQEEPILAGSPETLRHPLEEAARMRAHAARQRAEVEAKQQVPATAPPVADKEVPTELIAETNRKMEEEAAQQQEHLRQQRLQLEQYIREIEERKQQLEDRRKHLEEREGIETEPTPAQSTPAQPTPAQPTPAKPTPTDPKTQGAEDRRSPAGYEAYRYTDTTGDVGAQPSPQPLQPPGGLPQPDQPLGEDQTSSDKEEKPQSDKQPPTSGLSSAPTYLPSLYADRSEEQVGKIRDYQRQLLERHAQGRAELEAQRGALERRREALMGKYPGLGFRDIETKGKGQQPPVSSQVPPSSTVTRQPPVSQPIEKQYPSVSSASIPPISAVTRQPVMSQPMEEKHIQVPVSHQQQQEEQSPKQQKEIHQLQQERLRQQQQLIQQQQQLKEQQRLLELRKQEQEKLQQQQFLKARQPEEPQQQQPLQMPWQPGYQLPPPSLLPRSEAVPFGQGVVYNRQTGELIQTAALSSQGTGDEEEEEGSSSEWSSGRQMAQQVPSPTWRQGDQNPRLEHLKQQLEAIRAERERVLLRQQQSEEQLRQQRERYQRLFPNSAQKLTPEEPMQPDHVPDEDWPGLGPVHRSSMLGERTLGGQGERSLSYGIEQRSSLQGERSLEDQGERSPEGQVEGQVYRHSKVRGPPPVVKRVGFTEDSMAHELSTIQEVDTPRSVRSGGGRSVLGSPLTPQGQPPTPQGHPFRSQGQWVPGVSTVMPVPQRSVDRQYQQWGSLLAGGADLQQQDEPIHAQVTRSDGRSPPAPPRFLSQGAGALSAVAPVSHGVPAEAGELPLYSTDVGRGVLLYPDARPQVPEHPQGVTRGVDHSGRPGSVSSNENTISTGPVSSEENLLTDPQQEFHRQDESYNTLAPLKPDSSPGSLSTLSQQYTRGQDVTPAKTDQSPGSEGSKFGVNRREIEGADNRLYHQQPFPGASPNYELDSYKQFVSGVHKPSAADVSYSQYRDKHGSPQGADVAHAQYDDKYSGGLQVQPGLPQFPYGNSVGSGTYGAPQGRLGSEPALPDSPHYPQYSGPEQGGGYSETWGRWGDFSRTENGAVPATVAPTGGVSSVTEPAMVGAYGGIGVMPSLPQYHQSGLRPSFSPTIGGRSALEEREVVDSSSLSYYPITPSVDSGGIDMTSGQGQGQGRDDSQHSRSYDVYHAQMEMSRTQPTSFPFLQKGLYPSVDSSFDPGIPSVKEGIVSGELKPLAAEHSLTSDLSGLVPPNKAAIVPDANLVQLFSTKDNLVLHGTQGMGKPGGKNASFLSDVSQHPLTSDISEASQYPLSGFQEEPSVYMQDDPSPAAGSHTPGHRVHSEPEPQTVDWTQLQQQNTGFGSLSPVHAEFEEIGQSSRGIVWSPGGDSDLYPPEGNRSFTSPRGAMLPLRTVSLPEQSMSTMVSDFSHRSLSQHSLTGMDDTDQFTTAGEHRREAEPVSVIPSQSELLLLQEGYSPGALIIGTQEQRDLSSNNNNSNIEQGVRELFTETCPPTSVSLEPSQVNTMTAVDGRSDQWNVFSKSERSSAAENMDDRYQQLLLQARELNQQLRQQLGTEQTDDLDQKASDLDPEENSASTDRRADEEAPAERRVSEKYEALVEEARLLKNKLLADMRHDGRGSVTSSQDTSIWSSHPQDGQEKPGAWHSLEEMTGISEEPDLTLVSLVSEPATADSSVHLDQSLSMEDSLRSFQQHEMRIASAEATPGQGGVRRDGLEIIPPAEGGGAGLEGSSSCPIRAVEETNRDRREASLQEAFARKRPDFAQKSKERLQAIESKKDAKALTGGPTAARNAQLAKTVSSWKKLRSAKASEKQQSPVQSLKPSEGRVQVVTKSTTDRQQDVKAMYDRNRRLYEGLEEVKQKKAEKEREDQRRVNRQRAKEFQKKTLAKIRKKEGDSSKE
ncbi:centrosomal protein of 295 kDa [Lingula anatina]|uniref:Centrosomal protein of 295 kDa n=1 Tax=Lingula anatina TaxID=7574 RepID=A0A1S3H5Z9_LINAN|nr:centrosomal protein of 295 kDa [Lingula anatina]|eukprot:XP_013380901.1 centrosomal protein of 295 kDa [Lingula anatina]